MSRIYFTVYLVGILDWPLKVDKGVFTLSCLLVVCHYDDTLLLLLAGEDTAAAGQRATEQAASAVLLLVVAVGVMDSWHHLQQGGCLFRPHQLRQLGQCAPEPE